MIAEDHSELVREFFDAQEPLPPCMADVLHENLWDLYESNPPKDSATQSKVDRMVCLGERME
jgi:hypothetical protein